MTRVQTKDPDRYKPTVSHPLPPACQSAEALQPMAFDPRNRTGDLKVISETFEVLKSDAQGKLSHRTEHTPWAYILRVRQK